MKDDSFRVQGGKKLCGEIYPSGNKNEALPVIAATLLTSEEVILKNIPFINDTMNMIALLKEIGSKVIKIDNHTYKFKRDKLNTDALSSKTASKIRSSLLFMGPLLAIAGKVKLPISGGDKIGRRRIDSHLIAFEKLGAEINDEDGCTISLLGKAQGNQIILDEASVMGTENAIMVAAVAKGKTIIYNAACEPHVQGLCCMLVSMGSNIFGIGTNMLIIEGKDSLNGCTHKISPDHIEIGSFIGLAAATGSSITIKNGYYFNPIEQISNFSPMSIIIPAFKILGINIEIKGNDLIIDKKQDLVVKDDIGGKIPIISDQPWPAFPADLTSIMVVTALFSKGVVMVHEKLFEGRLFFVDSLIRMGAKIVLCDPHRVVISGPSTLKGIELSSPDIRAGMAMLIAAMAADGESIIHNVKQIDRGYENIEERLNSIGASIERI